VSGVCVSAPELGALAVLGVELDAELGAGLDDPPNNFCLILCAIEYDGAEEPDGAEELDGVFALSAAFLSAYAPRPPIAAPANPAAIALPTPDIDPR
jgi:hypothetical protein